jgi:hypothetical protein
MFHGYAMAWFEYEPVTMVAAFLPAALFFIERLWRQRGWGSFLGLIWSAALPVGAGHPHIVMFQWLFISGYLVYKAAAAAKTGAHFQPGWQRALRRPLGLSVLAIAAAVLISASFFAMYASLNREGHRKAIPFNRLSQETGSLPAQYLTTLLFPDFYGSPVKKLCFTPYPHPPQPYNNYNELCVYMGILPLFMAFSCLVFLRRRFVLFYCIAAIVTLAMAMGSVLYYPLARFVPGLALSTPARTLYIFGFAMTVLAAIGFDGVAGMKTRKRAVASLWAVLAGAGAVIAVVVQTKAGAAWFTSGVPIGNMAAAGGMLRTYFSIGSEAMLRPLLLIAVSVIALAAWMLTKNDMRKRLCSALLLAILAFDLISFGTSYNTASPRKWAYPPTPAIRFLQSDTSHFRVMISGNFLYNGFVPFGIEDIGGYASFYPQRIREYIHLSQHGLSEPVPHTQNQCLDIGRYSSPLLDIINAKYWLVPPGMMFTDEGLRQVYNGEIAIYENINVFGRAFFVPQYEYCTSPRQAYERLGTYRLDDFKQRVIVEARPPDGFSFNDGPAAGADVRITSYLPNSIACSVVCPSSGFLVVSQNYHPGWRANVDGTKTGVLRGNYLMCAVPLRQGSHTVVMTFRPAMVLWGLAVSACGWLLLSVFTVYYLMQSRHRRKVQACNSQS